ncbi:helix-turn-helix transcriptional regulator [Methylobacterium oryzisoli]|uniref:helix-turn-helix transcriptional regulator n=1 Tax=Methylobacterium oryzisoli TaxID=3385502 RepID=UPI003892316C
MRHRRGASRPPSPARLGAAALRLAAQVEAMREPAAVATAFATCLSAFAVRHYLVIDAAGRIPLSPDTLAVRVLALDWPEADLRWTDARRLVTAADLIRRCLEAERPFGIDALLPAPGAPGLSAAVPGLSAAVPGLSAAVPGRREGAGERLCVPVHGPQGLRGCVCLAGRAPPEPEMQAALDLAARAAFGRLRALAGPACEPRPAPSPRERDVLVWTAQGKTAWEIARILGLARSTVEEHARNAVRKLGAQNKAHAVALALRAGIIS